MNKGPETQLHKRITNEEPKSGTGRSIPRNIAKTECGLSALARLGAPFHGYQPDQKSSPCSLAPKRLQRIAARSRSRRVGNQNDLYAPEDEIEWVYFPSSGMISILQTTPDSRGIELATIGKEGVLGAMAGFGLNYALTASVVQMPLTAVKISAVRFRNHFSRYASLQEMALKSNEVILAQTQITAACNALHNVEQRFCRWLLQTWYRSETNTITLTQEFLGEMLGVRRTSVTEIASKLQAAGLIRYRRGQIEVLNRSELEERSCGCFEAVRYAEKIIMRNELKK